MLKKIALVVVMTFCVVNASSLSLLDAIEQAAEKITGELPRGSRVAVVAFESDNEKLSNFIMDELTGAFVEYGLEVADRRNLEFLEREFEFQMSGMVNDESIVRVGQLLAANMIVSGQIVRAGDIYRFRVNAVRLEQGTHASTTRFNVRNDAATQRMIADITGQAGGLRTARTEVVEVYRANIENAPRTAGAFLDRGILFLNREDYGTAIADFNEALRLNPNMTDAYIFRGFAYFSLRDYNRAIADFTQVIRLEPNDAFNYYHRGLVYDGMDDHDRAIADFTHAIRLGYNEAHVYYSRGVSYAAKGDNQAAITDFSQAIRLDPNGANAYIERGYRYGIIGDYNRAIADFSQAIRLNPNNYWAYAGLGDLYYEIGDYDRAITYISQAIRINPSANLYDIRGIIYATKGDYNRAITDFTQALRIDPNNTSASRNLERARRARGGW